MDLQQVETDLQSGETYTVTYGGNTTTINMSSTIYSAISGGMGGGGMGGQGGGMGGDPDAGGGGGGQGGPGRP